MVFWWFWRKEDGLSLGSLSFRTDDGFLGVGKDSAAAFVQGRRSSDDGNVITDCNNVQKNGLTLTRVVVRVTNGDVTRQHKGLERIRSPV